MAEEIESRQMAESLRNVNWKEVGLVVVLGGFGGLLSYLHSLIVGNPPNLDALITIFASIGLGMGAAFVRVYMITNVDRRAILRGLGW